MIDNLIPVGSVVRLKEVDALVVILGYFPDDGERMYDYFAAPYPTGLASENHAILLDADGVAEVVSQGYLDDMGKKALEAAATVMNAREQAFITIGMALEESGELQQEGDSFRME